MRKRITSLLLSMVMVSGLLFTAVPVHASEEGVEPDQCEHDFSLAKASDEAVMTPGTCDNEAVFYYTCGKCGAIECDENHTFTGEENHNPSDVWGSDYSEHWHECKDCKEKLDFAVHIPDHEGHATEDYAITCKVCGWVMEEQVKQIQMEIPYKLVVKKTGEADPTKETFKFVIEEFKAPVEYKIISDAIETNGEKTYNGTFTFMINSNLLGNISEGFVLRQIKGNASGWTCDETSYRVVPHININENGVEYWAFNKLDKDGYINEEDEVREAVFTNSYNAKKVVAPVQKKAPDDKMKSPKTGNDSLMVIWTTMILAAALAFMGLTTVSHRRK